MFKFLQTQKPHATCICWYILTLLQGWYWTWNSWLPMVCCIYCLGRIVVIYIIFGLSEGMICYTLTGISLIFLGILMIVLQPYKSSAANAYNIILVLFIAIWWGNANNQGSLDCSNSDRFNYNNLLFAIIGCNSLGCILYPLQEVSSSLADVFPD